MFSKNSLFLTLLASLALISCRPSKDFPENFKGEQIHFGQGGGFSGMLTYFALMDDGRLFQRELRDSTFALRDNWDKPFVKQMFTNYESLHLNEVECYEPGDIYYFIQFKSGDNPSHQIVWGKPGFSPDEKIVKYYNLLYKSTKSKS